jgi:hypothetical protein
MVRVTVRSDTGGGIGDKVVWRVNGVTGGMGKRRATSGKPSNGSHIVTETCGSIRARKPHCVLAYNGAGLFQTEPYRISIGSAASPTRRGPHMFGIAVSERLRQQRMGPRARRGAAEGLCATLQAAASASYPTMPSRSASSRRAGHARGHCRRLRRDQERVAPTDVFVLYVAGHGRTVESTGTYYFCSDLTFDGGRSVEDGIGQDTWQAWLKQIAAEKSIRSSTHASAAAAGLTRGA